MLNFLHFTADGTAIVNAVTLVALPVRLVLQLFLALRQVYGRRLLSTLLSSNSTTMRGVPPPLLLFVLYFIMTSSVNLSPFWAVLHLVMVFLLNEGLKFLETRTHIPSLAVEGKKA